MTEYFISSTAQVYASERFVTIFVTNLINSVMDQDRPQQAGQNNRRRHCWPQGSNAFGNGTNMTSTIDHWQLSFLIVVCAENLLNTS